MPRLWLELLAITALATLVLTMVWQGRDVSRIGPALGLFAAAAFRLMPSVNRLLGAVQSMRYGLPIVDVLLAELALSVPTPVGVASGAPGAFRSEIRLLDVSYTSLGPPRPQSRDSPRSCGKASPSGAIGPSGSGKSTVVDVILGLLPPQSGEVSVDGRNIGEILRCWQTQIGYVRSRSS